MAGELLSGLHAKQPDRRQDLGRALPAVDCGALLEQGALQRGGARPRQTADELGRANSLRAEAYENGRFWRRNAMGHPGAVLGIPVLAVPRVYDTSRRYPHERGG